MTSSTLRPRALRRAAATAAALVGVLAARPAAAQFVSVGYSPVCAATPCSTFRFTLENRGATSLVFNTLTLTATAGNFVFAPDDPGAPTVGSVQGEDSQGEIGATATIGAGGTSLFTNFLVDAGFPFEVFAGASGFLDAEVDAAVAGGPAPTLSGAAFTFGASVQGSGGPVTIGGPAAVVPEPATLALVGAGLAGAAALARRRRAA